MRGFTLIELMVVMVIILLITAMGIASLRRTAESQLLPTEAKKLVSVLRQLQTSALTGFKPDSGCDITLNGYEIAFNSSYYEYRPSCTSVAPTPTFSRANLPSSLSITTTANPAGSTLLFKVLAQGADRDMHICFTGTNQPKKYEVRVTLTGEIQDIGYVDTCPSS